MIKKRDRSLKFNLVDLVVVLLAVVCIATIVARAVVIEKKYAPLSDRNCIMEFEIDVNDVTLGVIEHFVVGDVVNSTFKSVVLNEKGEEKERTDKIILGALTDDLKYTDDSKTKVKGSIVVKGILTESGIEIDGIERKINVGDELEIATEKILTKIKVVSIEWEK